MPKEDQVAAHLRAARFRRLTLWVLMACGSGTVACDAELGPKDPHSNASAMGGAHGEGPGRGPGQGEEEGERDSEVLSDDTPGGAGLSCDEDADLATHPLLKLSTVQYRNTVSDLLARYGLESLQSQVSLVLSAIPNDSLGDSFRGLDDRVELSHVQGYFDVGVTVGDALQGDPELLARVAGDCTQNAWDDSCFEDFLDGFLNTVYRRPLSKAERDSYFDLFEESESAAQAIRSSVIVALSSPRFVYHVEVDGAPVADRQDLLHLDAYELASRLSYTFWQTMPDQELLDRAEDGSLLEEDEYELQLMRVWEDERSSATIERFWVEWLRLEKFTGFETARPAFASLSQGFDFESHDYYADMVEEVLDLTRYFTFDQPGTVRDLLETNISLTQSAELAELYGVEPWDGNSDFPTFDSEERSGLLQRAALLVSNLEQTNPFHRGALIRRNLLCDPLPQPDPNELPPGALDIPPIDEARTTRERFEEKVEGNGLCATCHNSFSNIGYVLESFDALGRFRTRESVFDEQTGELLAELPIDTAAEAFIVSQEDPPVQDAHELNRAIAESGKVEACLAQNYLSYFARRAYQSRSLDNCVVKQLSETLAEQDGGLSAAFLRLAQLPTFFSKKVGEQ